MLSKDLILSYAKGDKIFPKLIRAEPENFKPIEEALTVFKEMNNVSRRDVEEALQSVFNRYYTPKPAQGIISIITQSCVFEEELKPDAIKNRDELFNQAAEIWKNENANIIPPAKNLNQFFTKRFNLPEEMNREALEEYLYPDIRKNRRLLEIPRIKAAEVLNRYNISQVQGILMDAVSAKLILHKSNNLMLRELLFKLRYLGLIFYIEDKRKNDRVTIKMEGPAVLSELVRAYGNEFSKILPVILKLKNTAWEFSAEIQSKKKEKPQKLLIKSDSGYFPLSHEKGVWFKQELTEFITRWNSQNDDIFAEICDTFFTDYSTVCQIPDIVFTLRNNNSKVYLEWVRYMPTDLIEKINRALPLIPKNYIFLFKGAKKKEAELAKQTPANVLAFRTVIPAQVLKSLIKDLTTDSQTVITDKNHPTR